MTMKTLIVYYSLSSNNEVLALELQRRLDCDIFKIEEPKPRTKFTILFDRVFNRTPRINKYMLPLETYHDFILVAPVWTSGIATPLKTFVLQEMQHINHYSFISVCGGGRDGQVDKIENELTMLIQQEPEKVTELWIADIIPPEKKEDIDYISRYRIGTSDLEAFNDKIEDFLHQHEALAHA